MQNFNVAEPSSRARNSSVGIVPSTSPSITCFPSGKKFLLDSPTFDIKDISHALSMTCRYNGHVRHFYSVAEHSVIVSLLMAELKLGDPMEGLMHDAHEAYVGDIVSPWKQRMPDFRKIEEFVETELRNYYYLPTATTFGCHQADRLAYAIEDQVLRSGDASDIDAEMRAKAGRLVDAGWRTLNLYPEEANKAFLKRYEELLP